MSELTQAQAAEVEKYVHNYAHLDPKKGRYAMGKRRLRAACGNIEWAWHNRDVEVFMPNYLDIGCGRGEMVEFASKLGFAAYGSEVVPELKTDASVALGPAWDLPYPKPWRFDLVTMFDVLEHLLPEDTIKTLREVKRVAVHTVFLTANNRPDRWGGFDLHVNRRPYEEWNRLLKVAFVGSKVTWLPKEMNISETWRIDI